MFSKKKPVYFEKGTMRKVTLLPLLSAYIVYVTNFNISDVHKSISIVTHIQPNADRVQQGILQLFLKCPLRTRRARILLMGFTISTAR